MYKTVIDIMDDSSKNEHDMLVYIAKNHPAVYAKSYKATHKPETKPTHEETFISELKYTYENKGRIAAVKLYREEKGADLRSTLAYVDEIAYRENWIPYSCA
jgi:hypothetical protein